MPRVGGMLPTTLDAQKVSNSQHMVHVSPSPRVFSRTAFVARGPDGAIFRNIMGFTKGGKVGAQRRHDHSNKSRRGREFVSGRPREKEIQCSCANLGHVMRTTDGVCVLFSVVSEHTSRKKTESQVPR